MKDSSWFEDLHQEAENTFEYKLEGLELEITEKLLEIMEKNKVSRSQLASKLGVSKASISSFFKSGSNVTLKRLLKITQALDCHLAINIDTNIYSNIEKVVEGKYVSGRQKKYGSYKNL